ncbi:MAG: hypothetical protein HUU37_00825 [Bdellovibrionales bacterium]|nr:hypothetical protein [Bdellovibrionales bacterium]
MKSVRAQRIATGSVGVLLLLFFCLRYWLSSQGKAFWMDESDGLHYTQASSLTDLVLRGAPSGQASKSPLHYVLDRIWMLAAGDRPQLWWDLRLYFRILPTTYWALASVIAGFFVLRELRERLPAVSFKMALCVSAGAATFLHSHSFMHIYAIESRAYPLWAALCVVHFLFFWRSVTRGLSRTEWWLYGFVCALLALTTYAALIQIGAGLGILVAARRLRREPVEWARVMTVIGVSVFLVGYYLLRMDKAGFPTPTWEMYFESVKELLAKSFHHSRFTGVYVTGPILLLLVPWWRRKIRGVPEAWLFTWAQLAATLALFLASRAANGIWGSRYVTYLIPSLTWCYFLGVVHLSSWISSYAPRIRVAHMLLALSLFEMGTRAWKVGKNVPGDLARFRARNSIGLSTAEGCNVPLPHDPGPLEVLNSLCRGIRP